MSNNVFARMRALMAPGRVQIGTVVAYQDGVATVELPGGGRTRARGQATVGSKVFFTDGVIDGPAPDLPVIVDVI